MNTDIDKLNIIQTQQREPINIERFFRDMDLTPQQIRERVRFAEEMRDYLLFLFLWIVTQYEYGTVDYSMATSRLTTEYRDIIAQSMEVDSALDNYTVRIADETMDTTQRHLAQELVGVVGTEKTLEIVNDSWYLSEARAVDMAVNMSLDVINYKDFVSAVARGFHHKKWISMQDRKVRKTHQHADGQVVLIGEYFQVGNARLAYPHDTVTEGSTGMDFPEEVINCRCGFKYIQ